MLRVKGMMQDLLKINLNVKAFALDTAVPAFFHIRNVVVWPKSRFY